MLARLLCTLLVCLALASTVFAQQTQTLVWDYTLTPTEVAAGAQAVTFNGSAITTAPTCVAKTTAPTGTTCSVPLPALQATNSASISFTRNGITAVTTVNGITQTAAATAQSPRIQINVTINLGS